MGRRVELEPGESLIEQWVAGIPHKGGTKVKWGGTLHLTDRRLVWEVTRLSRKGAFGVTPDGIVGLTPHEVIRSAVEGAVKVAANTVLRGADAAVGAILGDRSGVVVPLAGITVVRADGDRGSILHIETASGSLRLLVTASKWAYNAGNDRVARDAAVAAIDRVRTQPR